MSDVLRIQIQGPPGAGKSTVAREIVALLEKLGIAHELQDDVPRVIDHDFQRHAVLALAVKARDGKLRVLVETKTTNRGPAPEAG